MKCAHVCGAITILFFALVLHNFSDVLIMASLFIPYDPKTNWIYNKYRDYLMRNLQDPIPPIPIPELPANCTWDDFIEITHGLRRPAVIRQFAVNNPEGTAKLQDPEFWRNLKNENGYTETNCLHQGESAFLEDCTFKEFFDNYDPKVTPLEDRKPWYVGGPTQFVFKENPIINELLHDDLYQEFLDSGVDRKMFVNVPQMFMGFGGHGASVHSAAPLNLFRQVAGVKKWWLFDWSLSVELYTRFASHGMSVHTEGFLGHPNSEEPYAKFLDRLPRYELYLYPGDVLVFTPWMFHGIFNQGKHFDFESFNFGVAYRLNGEEAGIAAFKTALMPNLNQVFNVLWIGGGSLERGKQILFEGKKLRDMFKEAVEITSEQVDGRRS